MNAVAPRRAGAKLVAFLTAPPARCRVARQSFRQQISPINATRQLSTTSLRYQQPQSNPAPSNSDQAAANAQKVAHDLSPSQDSNPLRSLEPPGLLDQETALEGQPDWTRSYHGLSSTPFTSEQANILQQEIKADDIEIKPDGIIYLPEIKYRRILNRAFGPGGWGLAPRGETIVTGKLVTREYGLVCGGRLVSIARGEQQYFDPDGIPTATEGCKSNALMRCCKDLGVASELWDPRFIRRFLAENGKEMIVEHVTTKKRRRHFMRKDDQVRYPFKEVQGQPQQQQGGVKR